MYYVVRPVDANGELHAFFSPKAANEWAQTGAYQECGADICEIYKVDVASVEEAVELVRTGQVAKTARVHRRLSAAEIEEQVKYDAMMELKELGL